MRKRHLFTCLKIQSVFLFAVNCLVRALSLKPSNNKLAEALVPGELHCGRAFIYSNYLAAVLRLAPSVANH